MCNRKAAEGEWPNILPVFMLIMRGQKDAQQRRPKMVNEAFCCCKKIEPHTTESDDYVNCAVLPLVEGLLVRNQ